MSSPAVPTKIAAIVLAAGQGLRAGAPVPKQFAPHLGKPLMRHSVEAFAHAGISPILVATRSDLHAAAQDALAGIEGVTLVSGGAMRQDSVRAALERLASDAPDLVLIHDAARPGLTTAVILRLIDALSSAPGAIPVLPVVDSLFRENEGTVPRNGLHRVQTPQAFRFPEILAAHREWKGPAAAGDDAEVARRAGLEVALVEGDEALRKVTFAGDLQPSAVTKAVHPRTGTGFDVHRLVAGEELWLCGVRIDHDRGLSGHSDADVALHALTDAVLGAAACGDIGEHFPPTDQRWLGASSDRFLAHAVALAAKSGYAIGNVDVTIICEAPKIGPYRAQMRARIADILDVDIDAVSVKATTTERLGFSGRGEGIAVQASATVVPIVP
ncbi:bifunctional 2-C-methyl-D-erythritol 4-phosphate cytidylyltransferase/2-C-methyl-D-erythritol 2,4-cyclodiphosphate synthase [Novosphingobium tardum]|uniref:Bifunctional enzyme IspD/IspF n=1 Tax=Novosphingobium tardum TaxID=1538021 RepID=A0ABV8RPW9_9SPHN